MGQLPRRTSLISDSFSSEQPFALSFLQIPGHPGHPCFRLRDSGHYGSLRTWGNFPAPFRLNTCPAHQLLMPYGQYNQSNMTKIESIYSQNYSPAWPGGDPDLSGQGGTTDPLSPSSIHCSRSQPVRQVPYSHHFP